MRIHIIAVGTKMPAWVQTAYQEYAKRLPREYRLSLTEIPAVNRKTTGKDIASLREEEGLRLLKQIPPHTLTVALEVTGQAWTTEQFAEKFAAWSSRGTGINFLIGGPDGLSKACLEAADHRFSLSNLTFPHPMVRIILIEQIYRAYTILQHHPYHRD